MGQEEIKKGHRPSTIILLDRRNNSRITESSLIALQAETDHVLALGNEVKRIPQSSADVVIGSCLKNGAKKITVFTEPAAAVLNTLANAYNILVEIRPDEEVNL